MLATSRAGYPTEVQLELVVVALAWGDVLMNTCWNGNRMQSARHTWYIDAATNIHMDQCILHELFDAMFSKVCSAMCSATWSARPAAAERSACTNGRLFHRRFMTDSK